MTFASPARSLLRLVVPVLLLLAVVASGAPAAAQQSALLTEDAEVGARPIPGPVVPPGYFTEAIANGTRTETGAPGPEYWQSWASYDIDAKLDPRSGLLSGDVGIRFENRSPEAIDHLRVHLHQNIHAPGVARRRPNEVTGGVTLHRVGVNGQELFEVRDPEAVGYRVQGSMLRLQPGAAVEPGGEAEIDIAWSFTVPASGSGRMGHSDREMYFLAYWFPKIGVYDDLRGWDAEPYSGGAEFYDDFGDYRVALTVPAGWTVTATGQLDNPTEVLSEQTLQRLAQAAGSDEVVRVATADDRGEGWVTAAPESGSLTYRFVAEGVRDFTWSTSDTQVWDATSAAVPDRDGDGAGDRVMIHSFFRPDRAPLWEEQARYAKHSIEFLSSETGFTYPWPHMSSIEGDGIIGGGMEFPMLTLIGSYQGREAAGLYGVTVHELAHMWTPLILGSNEKRHAWMDEGFATYLANRGEMDFLPEPGDPEVGSRDGYLRTAAAEAEGAMMRHGDYYEVGYGTASYAKPATMLVTLRNLLGAEVFEGAVRTYMQEWAFKNPSPWDFFNTMERAAGTDLDWFWGPWYYETWVLDHAVGGVETGPAGPVITIQDRGFVPMPVPVQIRTSGAGTLERTVPVSHWLTGATSYKLSLPAEAGEVLEVTIDPEALFPDIDRGNNVWPGPEEEGEES